MLQAVSGVGSNITDLRDPSKPSSSLSPSLSRRPSLPRPLAGVAAPTLAHRRAHCDIVDHHTSQPSITRRAVPWLDPICARCVFARASRPFPSPTNPPVAPSLPHLGPPPATAQRGLRLDVDRLPVPNPRVQPRRRRVTRIGSVAWISVPRPVLTTTRLSIHPSVRTSGRALTIYL